MCLRRRLRPSKTCFASRCSAETPWAKLQNGAQMNLVVELPGECRNHSALGTPPLSALRARKICESQPADSGPQPVRRTGSRAAAPASLALSPDRTGPPSGQVGATDGFPQAPSCDGAARSKSVRAGGWTLGPFRVPRRQARSVEITSPLSPVPARKDCRTPEYCP